jgi:heme exporter protein D
VIGFALSYTGFAPIHVAQNVGVGGHVAAGAGFGLALAGPVSVMMAGCPRGALDRHEWEEAVIRFLTGFGYVFFTAAVAIPFYVMVMTSLKTQGELIANPLDFSIDLSRGWALFRSYEELFSDFNFGRYMWTSFYVSVLTVLITLLFSIPGAYAVARLRFRGQRALSRSILLIYMVPMIVLALPIYIAFSMTGLRNSILGIVMIYPVTTIPVALYMLQGYFRGLAGGDRGGGADGRAEPAAGDLEDHAAPVAAGAGERVALRLHDRVERVPARVHAARRSVEVHADAGDRLAQFLGDPAPAPDGGCGDRDGAGDGAVPGAGEVHDPRADRGIGEGMRICWIPSMPPYWTPRRSVSCV